MKAIDFIKNKLETLATKFPLVEIRYGFNLDINTHIIQFDPIEAYYNLPELDAAWIPFSLEFDETFADESIAFIGSDSILSISNNYEFGWNIAFVDVTFEGFKQLLAESDFSTHINMLPDTIIYSPYPSSMGILYYNQMHSNVIEETGRNIFFTSPIPETMIEVQEEGGDLIDNDKYAMAA